jgi:hypothetical protein
MAKDKKRPSKNAKAAQKAVSSSKLLTSMKDVQKTKSATEFASSAPTPRTSTAKKARPSKKRG